MKFNTPNSGFVNSDQMLGGVGFKIKATAKTIRTLVDTLYRYKEEAVARELVSNCVDAHKLRDQKHRPSMSVSHTQSVYANKLYFENNKELEWLAPFNKPFNLHVPTEKEPYFECEDFGVGLPLEKILGLPLFNQDYINASEEERALMTKPEEMYLFGPNGKVIWSGGMYTTLFDSPKDDDNSQIGGFGLGAKSPSTISDSYTVETRFNGEKYIIFIYEDSQRMPTAELISCDEYGLPKPIPMVKGQEYNGMTVRVPVTVDRIEKFSSALSKVMRFFDTPYLFTNKKVIVRKPDFVSYFHNTYITSGGTGRHYAVQGGVVYPIDINMLSYDISHFFQCLQRDTYTFFDIGQVNMQPSREDLEYDQHTIRVLEDVLGEAVNKVTEFLKTYRIGNNIFEKIKNFEKLKTMFNTEILRDYLPTQAVIEEDTCVNPTTYMCDMLGVEFMGNHVNFGSSKQITEYGYAEGRDFSLSKYCRYDIDTKYIYPQFRSDGTPYKNYFVFMDGQGALKKAQELYSNLVSQLSQVDKTNRYYPYLTPITIDGKLTSLILNKVYGISKEKFATDIEDAFYSGTLKEKFGYTFAPKPEEFLIDARMSLIRDRQETDLMDILPTEEEIKEKSFELYEVRVSEHLKVLANDCFNKVLMNRDTSFKVYAFLREYFESVGAEIYHVDNIAIKPEEITLENIKKLKGITVIEHHKWCPISGEKLMEWIKEAQNENKQIPFVYLRGHEIHEDSNLGKKINSVSTINLEIKGIKQYSDELDLIKSSYHERVIGVRVVGRKFFEEHKEVFVPLKEMLDTCISLGVSKLIDTIISNKTREIYNIQPNKHDLVKDFKFMSTANLYVPNSFTEQQLSYHKQCFKKSYDKFRPTKSHRDLKVGAYLLEIASQNSEVVKLERHYQRIYKFWESYLDIFTPFTSRFGINKSDNFSEKNVLRKLTKRLEYEEVYRRANMIPNHYENQLIRDWIDSGVCYISNYNLRTEIAKSIREYSKSSVCNKPIKSALYEIEDILEKYLESDDLRLFYKYTVLSQSNDETEVVYNFVVDVIDALADTDDEI
ncbi:hypothetical protein Kuja_1380 [Vibrio phage vB_VchM_Kuja]|uniref:RIIA protein n=1 Tax=Vibrio phage vB_VchM_Kuja TaxID=2686437 RepID=A0A6B9J9I3_9CAUD|nr:RIIA lysis inhibitor [Vibrio phage vB_VchM_Kuja]QGZ16129.1 hypothetical protein Kuja_1380 [Vibrio phage vB_VchM_Kuja]